MTVSRTRLPHDGAELYLTDAGIETTLIFDEGFELPHFAAFTLLASEVGRAALGRYYHRHARVAETHGTGFVFESATWRASRDWGERLGYTDAALADANRAAIALLETLRAEFASLPSVVSGCVGPRGDGYDPGALMSAHEAERYHAEQIETFATTAAELIGAITMTNVPEAIGVARAAHGVSLPIVVSFTVETDGTLPDGTPLGRAIETVDSATGGAPAYYMINCAHPSHFRDVLGRGAGWTERVRGVRANASRASHAELDAAETLDRGDARELARDYAELRTMLPQLNVLGGCCGTDHRHIERIAAVCAPSATR